MSAPVPQKKALTVFPYTREGFSIVDVVPYQASYTKIFRAGMLVSYVLPPTAQVSGYWQNYATGGQGEALNKTVDFCAIDYTDLAALAFAGIIAHSFPENRPALGDQYGDLDLEDRDLAPYIDTIAGAMQRTSCAIGGTGMMLCRFWDSTGGTGTDAALVVGDVGKIVYVSKTDGGSFTGKAGYATVADQSGTSGIVRIGTLVEIPVLGGEWGYIKFDGAS